MNLEPPAAEPLLAICVPTFNRATNLRNLFRSLGAAKARFGSEIEICVSNNASTDDTRVAIEDFTCAHAVLVRHQTTNLGATLNLIEVASMMQARWGIWCGDDDELNLDAVERLLALLRTLAPEIWVIVDSAGPDGYGQYLRRYTEGGNTANAFRYAIMRNGLDAFGFMGVHVFPRSAVPILQALRLDEARPWPHIAGLLRHVMQTGTRVHVLPENVIQQAKGGAVLFWSGSDLARIRIAKLRIIRCAQCAPAVHPAFLRFLMLREMYSLGSIKAIVAWKLYEGEDYDSMAVPAYLKASGWMGLLLPLAFPYALLALGLRAVPQRFYVACFRFIGQGGLLSRYQQLKCDLGIFDGTKRGL